MIGAVVACRRVLGFEVEERLKAKTAKAIREVEAAGEGEPAGKLEKPSGG